MKACSVYVLVLEPDEAYRQWIWACKERVRQLVGDQLYLDHPPHATLYVSAFPAQADLCGPVAQLAQRLPAPRAVMNHWHVFQADQLTGNSTLVLDVPEDRRASFRQIQTDVVNTLSPLRDRAASQERYAGSWQRLSPDEQANVDRFGFPFVGSIWHAHVTIGSIRLEDWPAIRPVLQETPPTTVVCFTHLAVHVLENGEMPLVERFAFQGPNGDVPTDGVGKPAG